MPRKQDKFKQKTDHFKDALRRNGVKLTHQRMIIFQEVADSAEHPNVESVFKTVRKTLPMVSLDTVYRTLWMLQDLGLVHILGGRDRVRFDGNTEPHHHFVCNECGWMRDFHSNAFDRLKVPKEIKNLGNGETVHIEVKGVCIECAKKSAIKLKKISQP